MERTWEPRASELILAPRISPFVPIAISGPPALQGSLGDPNTSANIFFSEPSENSRDRRERARASSAHYPFSDPVKFGFLFPKKAPKPSPASSLAKQSAKASISRAQALSKSRFIP